MNNDIKVEYSRSVLGADDKHDVDTILDVIIEVGSLNISMYTFEEEMPSVKEFWEDLPEYLKDDYNDMKNLEPFTLEGREVLHVDLDSPYDYDKDDVYNRIKSLSKQLDPKIQKFLQTVFKDIESGKYAEH